MHAYDYDEQQWITGRDAAALHIKHAEQAIRSFQQGHWTAEYESLHEALLNQRAKMDDAMLYLHRTN